MEHYVSLHGITNGMMKLKVGSCIWIQKDGNGGRGIKSLMGATFLGLNFLKLSMRIMFEILTILGGIPCYTK